MRPSQRSLQRAHRAGRQVGSGSSGTATPAVGRGHLATNTDLEAERQIVLQQWIYRARDTAEGAPHVVRNSPVSSVIHGLVGMGGVATAAAGAVMTADAVDKADKLRVVQGAGVLGGGVTVLLTAGAQFATPQHMTLQRGINPLYFLGVGSAAFSFFGLNKLRDAYEH